MECAVAASQGFLPRAVGPCQRLSRLLTAFSLQVVSSRTYAQRAVLKFATHTGANYMGGKWVPGTLTNQNTKK